MIFPPEITYYIQVISAISLSIVMGVAGIYWILRMHSVGGTAGREFAAFFLLISIEAIFNALYPTASSRELATILGCISYLCVNAGVLCIFLAGEYSMSDRPPPWRMTLMGLAYGIVWLFIMNTILSQPGTGMLYMSYVTGFGWVMYVTPEFMWINGLFAIVAISFFLEFCVKAYRAARPSSKFGTNARRLIFSFIFSLVITGLDVGIGWIFTDLTVDMPPATMVLSCIFIIYVFYLLSKEYRIMFLLPHKATCLFVLNTSGVVYYDHMFQSDDDPLATIDLFAPALAAVNFIIQESLQLKKNDWIEEFHTDERTFLLETRADCDLVGILLVSKPTQMLRKSLVHFIDHLNPIWRGNGNKLLLDGEEIMKINEIIKDAFPFIPS